MTVATTSPSRSDAVRRPALPDVIAEHLEEHGFLALQRRALLFSPDVPARRIAEHDERLAAHWDGLVVNQPESVALAEDKLAADDPWERASAIRFWLAHGRPTFEALAARWAETPPEHAASWREALRGLDLETIDALVPPARRPSLTVVPLGIVVDALGWHAAPDPALVRAQASHADPAVRAATARHAHRFPTDIALPLLAPLLDDTDDAVRRRALWSLMLLDRAAALDRARARSRRPAPEPFALRVLGIAGEPDDHARLVEAAATDLGRPAAFFAFADFGTPEAIESLIRLLTLPDPATALVVTEALETALGRIPRKAADGPATPEEARAHAAPIVEGLRPEDRVMAGQPWPWSDEASEEPGRSRWRSAVAGSAAGKSGRRRGRSERSADDGASASPELRREVPDGFFDALPAIDVRPGE